MTVKDHFATLGLKPGASEDDIKKSYRTLAKKYHPDKNKEKGAEEKFKEISAAYDYLKSSDRRIILEADLKRAKEAPSKAPSDGGFSSFFKAKGDKSYSSTTGQNDTAYSSKYKGTSYSKRFGTDSKEDNFTWSKKEKKGSKSKKKKKPWNDEWNTAGDSFRTEDERPSFSFAFKTFVDDLDSNFSMFFKATGPFEFSAFYGDNSDPFAEFFTDLGGAEGFTNKQKTSKDKKRHVADEYGYSEGLDEEYLFSPRQGQSRGTMNNSDTEDDEPGFRFSMSESDTDDDYQETRFKCAFCGKRLPLDKLKTHEPACGRRKKKEVNIDSDGEFDPDGYAAKFGAGSSKFSGDWRGTHEELLRHIRRQRKAARETRREAQSDLETVICKWCGRSFSRRTSERHIPFCEKWTKEHGRPMSPSFTDFKKSKTERAKDYAKKVPRPKGHKAEDEDDFTTPRDYHTPREKGTKSRQSRPTSFPDINDKPTSRPTTEKAFPSSGTGLNPSSTPRSSRSTPHKAKGTSYRNMDPPHFNRSTNNQTPKFRSTDNQTPKFRNTDDSTYSTYSKGGSFGVSGTSYGGGLKGTGLSGSKLSSKSKTSKPHSHHVKFADV